ncbi:MAG: family 78 glycoside hydrolase catalytic domain, partial [Clostridia bacterium]|nr:family 78 glycoside hydrolase catalytic domain [Clostridia bacterium]
MFEQAKWMAPAQPLGDVCPVFKNTFTVADPSAAVLAITAMGVYDCFLNGHRVGNFVLAPGWTAYQSRLQYQEYEVSDLLTAGENELCVRVAPGWYRSRIGFNRDLDAVQAQPAACILQLTAGGTLCTVSDESWQYAGSALQFCDIYDGELYDARVCPQFHPVAVLPLSKDTLIPQEGEIVVENESIAPCRLIVTPKGERVLDFGQNLTGYVQFTAEAAAGDRVTISHAEILDKDGNFYTGNYRNAKALLRYICTDGRQTYKPTHTFYGFRYIRLDEWPGEIRLEDFRAIVVHSRMKRTGFLKSGIPQLNQLFSNILWGQKGNFLDVPTDCPQRDERLGWTGDAEVFCTCAGYNFNVHRFFKKWLADLAAEQEDNGFVPCTIPSYGLDLCSGAAWADAATIVPWTMYQLYGDKEILAAQFDSMKRHVDFITATTTEENIWAGGNHYGDWVALDGEKGSCEGASDKTVIATAYYYYSATLVAKAGRVLGYDVSAYEALSERVREAFIQRFLPTLKTQTELTLSVHFGLTDDMESSCRKLAEKIEADGRMLQTGFVGTPYLLHALSRGGYYELAYALLLREEYPSWLYSVSKGATTIWEHWDGIMPDGSLWSDGMNSFNHYAYGSVAGWMFESMAGIAADPKNPGFKNVII